MSLLDHQIRDAVPLCDCLRGATTALIGYQVPNPASPGGLVSLGGLGLEITVSGAPAGKAPTVRVNWGDGSAENVRSSSEPTFVFPHAYLAKGTYTISILVTAANESVRFSIDTTIGHVLETTSGVFVRARQGANDTLDLTPLSGGAVQMRGNFLSYRTAPGRTPIYIDTLGGNDTVQAAATLPRALWVDAGAGNDRVIGGAGNDRIRGADGNDTLAGGAGNDLLFGDAGNDALNGGAGADALHGGSGADTLQGDTGNDLLFGDPGKDRLYGQDGNDFLLGGLDADLLYGGAGNDVLGGGYDNTSFEIAAGSILSAWQQSQGAAAARRLTAPVLFPATDLSAVPNTVLADGSRVVAAGSFGPALANDARTDTLNGGAGRDLLARSLVARRPDNDNLVLPDHADQLLSLADRPVATTAVTQLVGFTTTSGADVIGHPTRTVYAFGRYDTDTAGVIAALAYPKIPDASFSAWYGAPKPGTVVNLNLVGNTKGDFWALFNRPYVALAMGFRGRIDLVTDILDPLNYTGVDGARINPLPGRRREFDYLLGNYEPQLHPTTAGRIVLYAYDPLRKIMYPSG